MAECICGLCHQNGSLTYITSPKNKSIYEDGSMIFGGCAYKPLQFLVVARAQIVNLKTQLFDGT